MKKGYFYAIIIYLLMLPLTLSAQDFEVNGIFYNIIDVEKRTIEVTHQKNSTISYNGNISIPSSVTHNNTTYNVTAIGDYAFSNCSDLKSVSIPNSVTTIGLCAFQYCPNLSEINIPNTITLIGFDAFHDNAWYEAHPDGVIYISNVLYSYKGNLNMPLDVSVEVKEGIVSISPYAFYACGGITSITLPNSVTIIGNCAFQDCVNLSTINLPDCIATIDTGTFTGCTKLTSISLPENLKQINDAAFMRCLSLTSISVPDSVTHIGRNVFADCLYLQNATIGKNVISIGSQAFLNCQRLSALTSKNPIPPTCEDNVFKYVNTESCVLHVPNTSISQYQSANTWKDFYNISTVANISTAQLAKEVARYSINGKLLNKPCNGFNIVVFSDGTTKKEFIK